MGIGIEVHALHKRFGSAKALDGMTFDVAPGRVTGFVGPNGAGKSTTMRVILGLDRPDSGTALVGGHPYARLARPLTHVGSLLDASALQPSRSGRNHLRWLACSQGLPAQRVDEVIRLVGLGAVARQRASAYSLGVRQRLGIAAAMLGDPSVLMFDEPFNGMDPEGIVWLRGFLRGLAAQGRAVLVSSHLMGELQGAADLLVVVGRGRVVADASTAELIAASSGDRVLVRTTQVAEAEAALRAAEAVAAPKSLSAGHGELTVTGLAASRVVALLTRAGIAFSEVTVQQASLEQVYLELTRSVVDYASGGDPPSPSDPDANGAERPSGGAR